MAAAAPQRYQRLPGTGYRRLVPAWAMLLLFFVIGIFVLILRGRRVQLWLGDDHLLVVDWDGYREFYKRIRYQDVQTIVVRKTAEGRIINGILGGVALMFVALALLMDDSGAMIAFLVIASLVGLLLLVNVLSGSTCTCQLRTAVQTEELVSLGRVRQARKALDRLRPLITTAQGQLTPEEIQAQFQPVAPEAPAATETFVADDPNAPPRISS